MAKSFHSSRLFARELAAAPRSIGAICPSSSQLATAIAQRITPGEGHVLELGGGTGAITQALLERGVPARKLIVVERSAVFAAHLRGRFPDVPIVQADAARLTDTLPVDLGIDWIVSGLPLRSLPRGEAARIVDQWRRILRPGGGVVQFSYDILRSGGVMHTGDDFSTLSSRIVWMNMPPARVISMRRTDDRHRRFADSNA